MLAGLEILATASLTLPVEMVENTHDRYINNDKKKAMEAFFNVCMTIIYPR